MNVDSRTPCSCDMVEVLTYRMAMNELENSGEINVKLSMHSLEKQETTGSITICQQKVVCFVLDPVKESKRKKVGGWGNSDH